MGLLKLLLTSRPVKLLVVSMALGHIARPFLLAEEGDQVAFVCLMILLVMTAVRSQEKHAPLHPATARLLSPLRHRYVLPAAMLYGVSWLYARTALSQYVVDILRGH